MRLQEQQVAQTVAIGLALVQLLVALPEVTALPLLPPSSPPARLPISDPIAPPSLFALDATSGAHRVVGSAISTLWRSFLLPFDLLHLPCHIMTADMPGSPVPHPPIISGTFNIISCSGIMQLTGLALFINFSDSRSCFWPLISFHLNSTSDDAVNDMAYCSGIVYISGHSAPLHLYYVLHTSDANVSVNGSVDACGLNLQTVVFFRQDPNGSMKGFKYEFGNVTWIVGYDWFANNSNISYGFYGLSDVHIMYGICNQASNEYGCPHLSSNITSDSQLTFSLIKSDLRQGCQLVVLLCNCTGGESMANSTEMGSNSLANLLIKYVGYIKVSNISTSAHAGSLSKAGNRRYLIITIGSTLAGLLLVGVSIGLMCIFCKKRRKFRALGDEESYPNTLLSQQIVHFTYAQLQDASGDFKHKLGIDGFGSVYKGTLFNGSFVAIKQLESAIRGEKEFAFQVSFLHSLHHPNLVRIHGFCADDSRRLLISEFMVHGSLDAWIFHKPINKLEKIVSSLSSAPFLDWNARFNISLDVAKGLAFLHQSNLIHLDVKPQNILLDDEFAAKLSDYGLSRLMDQEEGYLIMHMRGATGYMAPEWLQHACATEKSDVYSYGMVLMEMLGGRKNVDLSRERESWYFPVVAARMYEEGKVLEVLDEKLTQSSMGERQCEQAKRLMQIAFWCILENPTKRPDMGSLLLMLQGHKEVPEPPLPSYFSGLNAHASMSNHDDNHHSYHDYYNQSGPSSPSCFNISFTPEPSSATTAYDVWSRGGGGHHDDCSLLLPSQDNEI